MKIPISVWSIAFTDTAGFSERLVSEPVRSGEVANTLATGVPAITGTPAVPQELTAVTADIADDDGLGTFSYQWHRGASASFVPTAGTAITAVRGINTYQLVEGDFDAYLLVVVAFTDQNGFSERLISQATAQIEGNVNRPATGQPMVTGVLDVGQMLTADTTGIADRDGPPEDIDDYSYQWQRSRLLNFDMASTTTIQGASEPSYTLVDADAGHYIRVVVSFTDGRSFPEELISAPTSSQVIARPNQSDTGDLELVGTAKVGSELTIAMSEITDPDGLPIPLLLAYRWHRGSLNFMPSAGTAIPGETGPSYRLLSSDQGQYIRVVVRFTDSRGFIEKRTSSAVSPSQFNFCDRTSGLQDFVLSNLAASSLGSAAPSTCSAVTLSHLALIEELDIGSAGNPLSSSLTSIDLVGLTALRRLSIVLAGSVTALPDDLFQPVLGSLATLQLTGPSVNSNPSPLAALPRLRNSSLQRLDITGFPSLTSFPAGFFDGLTELESLNLSGNGLTGLRDGLFGSLTALTQLQLQRNKLASLPNLIFNSLERLSTLDLSRNFLTSLPPNIFSRLASLTTLILARNSLVGLPVGVFDRMILLENLNLSSNALTSVPLVSLANLPRLTGLDLSDNPTDFPIPLRLIRTDSDGTLTGVRLSESLTRTARVSLPAFVPLALREAVSLSAVGAEITSLVNSDPITEVALDTEFRVTKVAANPNPTVLATPTNTGTQKGMRIVATEAVPLFSESNRAATGRVEIVGEASLDEVLRATQGTISDPDGLPSPFEAGASYQWYRGGSRYFTPGATAPPIGTSPTYQVTPVDVGRYLRVRVIFVDALGNQETSLSPATDRVEVVVNTDATGQPAITGIDSTEEGVGFTYFGATLVAGRGTIADVVNGLPATLRLSYQWQRSTNSAFDNPIPITDARSATYTPDRSEVSAGDYIRVEVGFADSSGFSEKLASAPLLVAETDLCARTPQVVERITQQIGGSPPCHQVTVANLAGITELDLSNQQITSLRRGDLAGLTQVSRIAIGGGASADATENNSLTTLPTGLFSGSGDLTGLTTLVIRNIEQLTAIEAGAFDGLPNLLTLDLTGSGLSVFPEEIRALTSLTDLRLASNALTAIPANALTPLESLTDLDLRRNALTEFPTAAILAASNSLTTLQLQGNQGAPYILPSEFIVGSYQSAPPPTVGGYGSLEASIGFTFRFITVQDADSFSSTGSLGGRITNTLVADEGRKLNAEVAQTEGRSLVITLSISSPNPANGITLEGASSTPVTLFETTVCARSQKVRVGIFNATQETPCALNTPAQLEGINSLDLSGSSISTLRADDFEGFTNLISLDLRDNSLSVFPSESIAPLTSLTSLDLSGNPDAPFAIPYEVVEISKGTNSDGDATLTLQLHLPAYAPMSLRGQSATLSLEDGDTGTLPDNVNVVAGVDFTLTQTGTDPVILLVTPPQVQQGEKGLIADSLRQPLFNILATGEISIEGTAAIGARLTAEVSVDIEDKDGLDDPLPLTYQWHRGLAPDFMPLLDTAIGGATDKNYDLTSDDVGSYIRVVVSFVDRRGNAESLISASRSLPATDLCDRTESVRAAILDLVPEVNGDCVLVTSDQLVAIEGTLDLNGQNLSALQAIDFAGLTGLTELNLSDTSLSAVPDLSSLVALTTLDLSLNSLTMVPDSSLPVSLEFLNLSNNSLTSVPGVSSLVALTSLNLSSNSLTPETVLTFALPVGLTSLDLSNNNLDAFPSAVIDLLVNLGAGLLDLSNNPSSVAPVPFVIEYELVEIGKGTNSEGNATLTLQLRLPAYMPASLRAELATLSLEGTGTGTLPNPATVGLDTDFTVTQTGTAPVFLVVTPPDLEAIKGLALGGVRERLFNAPATGEIIISGTAAIGARLSADRGVGGHRG